jgi:hypothetical protein
MKASRQNSDRIRVKLTHYGSTYRNMKNIMTIVVYKEDSLPVASAYAEPGKPYIYIRRDNIHER